MLWINEDMYMNSYNNACLVHCRITANNLYLNVKMK